MERQVRDLFARYEQVFMRNLTGPFDADEVAGLYTPEFIAASPAGVRTGANDAGFGQTMAQGYAHYRKIGTQDMRVGEISIQPIDALHCVAKVSWRATYARDDLPRTEIDFDIHYLVQIRDGRARVFGWVSGDEQALLKERGII